MKHMKKLWALLLALVMALALGVTAAATETVEVTDPSRVPASNEPTGEGNPREPVVQFTIVKKVEKASNAAAPTAETFEFVLEDTANEKKSLSEYGITLLDDLKIETNGVKDYTKKIKAKVDITKVNSNGGWEAVTPEGGGDPSSYYKTFYISEKDAGKDGWEYSTKRYAVKFSHVCGDNVDVNNMTCVVWEIGNDVSFRAAEFTNTYTLNTTHHRTIARNPQTPQPAETAIVSPKTFDAGIGLYAVSALLSVTGSAWLMGKKRK